jgi:hypothetical protein
MSTDVANVKINQIDVAHCFFAQFFLFLTDNSLFEKLSSISAKNQLHLTVITLLICTVLQVMFHLWIKNLRIKTIRELS